MLTTTINPAPDELRHLDFTVSPVCDWDDCVQQPRFVLRCTRCSAATDLCGRHTRIVTGSDRVECTNCHHDDRPRRYIAVTGFKAGTR